MANFYTAEEVDQKLETQQKEYLGLLVEAQKAIDRLEARLNGEVLTMAQIADRLHIKDKETISRYMKLPLSDPEYLPSVALNGKSKGAKLSEVEKWMARNTPEEKARRKQDFWLNKTRNAIRS